MNTHEVIRRVSEQRLQRFPNTVPGLGAAGNVPCRLDGSRLRVAFASAAPGSAPQLVARALAYCDARGYSIQWIVIPAREGEADLMSALLAHEFELEESQRLMAHEGPLAVAPNPRIAIAPITTMQAMAEYEVGSRASFFDDPHPMEVLVQRHAQERLREQQNGWYRYFASFLDGRPVGGCYYSRFEPVPTIMGVYTVPEARGHGVATALLAAVVGAILAERYQTCCLYVRIGNPAEDLYKRLGFVPLLDEFTFGHP